MTASRESPSRSGALIRAYRLARPALHPSVWVAPGAAIVGDVTIGEDSSVFFGCVLRGDVERIVIGARTNIQDQATLHVTEDLYPTLLGDEITVGHRAVVHGCRVADGALIGIGSIVLDGAEIGENALVAAGAVVRPGQIVEPGTLVAGVPARYVRDLLPDEIELQRARTLRYVETARRHGEADPI
jgi:carbonic anhydrase/acetyltransferase-like protein (isoleucine patch superfamily)